MKHGARARRRWQREAARRKPLGSVARVAIGIVVLLFAVGPFYLVAMGADQTGAVPVDGVLDGGLSTLDLTSIAGIVAATGAIVQVLKRLLIGVPAAKDVPVWVYTVVVALGLTVVANRVLHTLPGDLGTLAATALVSALGASGGYEWLRHGLGRPMAAAGTNMAKPLVGPDRERV